MIFTRVQVAVNILHYSRTLLSILGLSSRLLPFFPVLRNSSQRLDKNWGDCHLHITQFNQFSGKDEIFMKLFISLKIYYIVIRFACIIWFFIFLENYYKIITWLLLYGYYYISYYYIVIIIIWLLL